MTHEIAQLTPVGSQWKAIRSGTFFEGRVFTIVRHDMNERRVRYMYAGELVEMSKPFDTFVREYKQGNITHVGDAVPEATVSLCTGDVIKTGRRCSPLSSNSELTILDICGLTGRVKYRYKSGSTCTKSLSEFHDLLRCGLITVIGRAPSQKVLLEERLKAALRATEHRVSDLALSIGDHKIEGLKGEMFIRDNAEAEHKFTLKTTMEKPMTRIVNVFLMDTTPGLKAAERMIGKVENFASDAVDNTTLLLELSMEHDLKGMLHEHNKRRKAIINQDILNRVGKTVYLQPIELKDVKIDVQVVTSV